MKPVVKIISYSQIEWEEYIDFVQEVLGISPTRCLDRLGIPVKSPQAFVISLHNILENNNTLTNLSVLKTVQASFVIHANHNTIFQAQQQCDLTFLSRSLNDDTTFSIVSGTLYDWRLAIIYGCRESCTKDVRILFNSCFIILTNSGLKFLWDNFSRIKHTDGTILLKAI